MNKKIFLFIISLLFLIASFAYGQQPNEQSKKEKVTIEIKKLMTDLNNAMTQHDRPALEKIYADEFLFIHGFGFIDNKTVQINSIMESDSIPGVPLPPFDQFFVYGDMAMLRLNTKNPVGGNNLMSTSLYAKKDGGWQVIQVQSTQQQRERKPVTVESTILDSYTGKYVQSNGTNTIITRVSDTLMAQRIGRPKWNLQAVSDTQFFDKTGSSLSFFRDGNNKVTHFIWRSQNGQEIKWDRVE